MKLTPAELIVILSAMEMVELYGDTFTPEGLKPGMMFTRAKARLELELQNSDKKAYQLWMSRRQSLSGIVRWN